MFSRIFPRQADNTYRGNRLAILLLAVVSFMKGMQGTVSIFDTRNVVATADGIPLDSYGAAAGDTVVALTALLGSLLVLITLLGFVAVFRYRTLVPLMLLVQLIMQLGNRAILTMHPVVRIAPTGLAFAGHPIGFWVNLGILALTVIGFVLSLQNKEAAR